MNIKNHCPQQGVIQFPKQKEWQKEVGLKYQLPVIETEGKTNK